MQIGLFGGSFDPPHKGHQQVVAEVLALGLFDEVWYVPVGNHDFGKQMAPAEHRVAMLKLIQQPGSLVEDFEIKHTGTSYTHTTLSHLHQLHPEHTFAWIIGTDQLPTLHKWGCDQEPACFPQLVTSFPFYVYPRAGYDMELSFAGLIPLSHVTEVAISSTEIRQRLADGHSIAGLVDPAVAAYIQAHQLYTAI